MKIISLHTVSVQKRFVNRYVNRIYRKTYPKGTIFKVKEFYSTTVWVESPDGYNGSVPNDERLFEIYNE